MQELINRISLSIDELGMLLDHLHRFTQSRREKFYQEIIRLKNKLINLKSNLRQNNLQQTYQNYQQLLITMNRLKSEVMQYKSQKKPIINDISIRDDKSSKIQNKELMLALLVEKSDQIEYLEKKNSDNHEKIQSQQNIINSLSQQIKQLQKSNKTLRYENNEFKLEASILGDKVKNKEVQKEAINCEKIVNESVIINMKQQIQRLNIMLTNSEQKLIQYEQVADKSLLKSEEIEKNIKRYEEKVKVIYETQLEKQLKMKTQKQEIEYYRKQLNDKNNEIKLNEKNLRQLRQQNQELQNEINNIQMQIYNERNDHKKTRQIYEQQHKQLLKKYDFLKNEIQNTQNLNIINEELKKQLQNRIKEQQQNINILSGQNQQYKQQINILREYYNSIQERNNILEQQILKKQQILCDLDKDNKLLSLKLDQIQNRQKQMEITYKTIMKQYQQLKNQFQEQNSVLIQKNIIIKQIQKKFNSKEQQLKYRIIFLEKQELESKKQIQKLKMISDQKKKKHQRQFSFEKQNPVTSYNKQKIQSKGFIKDNHLGEQIKKLKEKNTSIVDQLQNMLDKNNRLEYQINSMKELNSTLIASQQNLKEKVKILQNKQYKRQQVNKIEFYVDKASRKGASKSIKDQRLKLENYKSQSNISKPKKQQKLKCKLMRAKIEAINEIKSIIL